MLRKKLLIILLLVVGCDNSTEPQVHPLVGVWEQTESKVTYISGLLSGSTVSTYGETITWIVGSDGVITYMSSTDSYSGTWSASGNKLTIISTEETTIFDYSISGNILTIFNEYDGTADGEDSFTSEIKFTKQ